MCATRTTGSDNRQLPITDDRSFFGNVKECLAHADVVLVSFGSHAPGQLKTEHALSGPTTATAHTKARTFNHPSTYGTRRPIRG